MWRYGTGASMLEDVPDGIASGGCPLQKASSLWLLRSWVWPQPVVSLPTFHADLMPSLHSRRILPSGSFALFFSLPCSFDGCSCHPSWAELPLPAVWAACKRSRICPCPVERLLKQAAAGPLLSPPDLFLYLHPACDCEEQPTMGLGRCEKGGLQKLNVWSRTLESFLLQSRS